MAMLRESSTSTAMMFCCGFSSATVIAGCHSSTSSMAASNVCRPQITQARQLRIIGAAWARRARIIHARPAAAMTISTTSIHFGHAPKREIWPRSYAERGYLKKNSNMGSCGLREEVRRIHHVGFIHGTHPLVGHGVCNVVQHDPKSKSRELFRVLRAVRPFPGIAEV